MSCLSSCFSVIAAIAAFVWAIVSGVFGLLWRFIKWVFGLAWDLVSWIFSGIWGVITGLASDFWAFLCTDIRMFNDSMSVGVWQICLVIIGIIALVCFIIWIKHKWEVAKLGKMLPWAAYEIEHTGYDTEKISRLWKVAQLAQEQPWVGDAARNDYSRDAISYYKKAMKLTSVYPWIGNIITIKSEHTSEEISCLEKLTTIAEECPQIVDMVTQYGCPSRFGLSNIESVAKILKVNPWANQMAAKCAFKYNKYQQDIEAEDFIGAFHWIETVPWIKDELKACAKKIEKSGQASNVEEKISCLKAVGECENEFPGSEKKLRNAHDKKSIEKLRNALQLEKKFPGLHKNLNAKLKSGDYSKVTGVFD
jgi:hypothetical protein